MREIAIIGCFLFLGAALQAKESPYSENILRLSAGDALEFKSFGHGKDVLEFWCDQASVNSAVASGFTNEGETAVDSLFVTSTGKKESVFKSLNLEYKHILNLEGTSAAQLYGATKFAVGELWADTEEVIESEVEDKFIKITGDAMQIEMTFLGMSAVYETRADITFRFKDGKLMYQITKLEYYSPASEYSEASWTIVPNLRIAKNNGKPDEAGIKSIENIKIFIRDIESAITKAITEDSDW